MSCCAESAASAASRICGSLNVESGAPGLFFKHEERPLFVVPDKLRVNEPRSDELNRGKFKQTLSFTLPPGAYATLVVRRLFWFATEGSRPMGPQGVKAQLAAATQEMIADASAPQPRGAPRFLGPPEKKPAPSTWGRPLEEDAKPHGARAPERERTDRHPSDRSEPMEPGAEPKEKLGFRARQKAKKDARQTRRTEAPKAPAKPAPKIAAKPRPPKGKP